MTIFYFTSTGNCLAVAKSIGGDLVSIPQVIDKPDLKYKDDVIGLVFPIYGWGMPKMVREFLENVSFEADYTYAIGTYGRVPGAAMMRVQKFALEHGNRFDYVQSLLMVDNYLPGFNMKEEEAMLPEKNVEENLNKIIADIAARKENVAKVSIGWRAASSIIQGAERFILNEKQAQKFIITEACTKCGICAKVCPAGNIKVSDSVKFSNQCEVCMGCLHQCPQNALHMKNEKSAHRWRNKEVSLLEIIQANNRSV